MDLQPTDPKTWWTALWTAFSAIGALFMGLLLWNIRRQVETVDDLRKRTTELEKDRVTKGDISAVYEQIDQTRESLTETASQNQQRTESRLDRLFDKVMELRK